MQLEERVDGVEAHHLPQVAAMEVTRGDRGWQATAAATVVTGEEHERGRERDEGRDDWLGRFDRPSGSARGVESSQVGWANQWAKAQILLNQNKNFNSINKHF
jgi:hypothetical protein